MASGTSSDERGGVDRTHRPPPAYGPALLYGGLVGRGCHDVHIRDLRTCTHAHLGCGLAHTRFADVHTCTSGICGLAHTRFADLHTCTSGICGLAHTRFADLHIRDLRKCNCFHVVATWQPRGNNFFGADYFLIIMVHYSTKLTANTHTYSHYTYHITYENF